MGLIDTLAKVGFDWRLALTNLINFGLIVWLLAKFLWPSIAKAIGERQKIIDQGLTDAESAKERLEQSQADYQAKLLAARQAAGEIINQADEQGQKIKEKLQQTAHQEVDELRQHVTEELAQAKQVMTADVQQQSADLVVAAVEKILQNKLDAKDDQRLVKQALKSLHG